MTEGESPILTLEKVVQLYCFMGPLRLPGVSANLEKLPQAVQRSKGIDSGLSDEGIIAVLNGRIARPPLLFMNSQCLIFRSRAYYFFRKSIA